MERNQAQDCAAACPAEAPSRHHPLRRRTRTAGSLHKKVHARPHRPVPVTCLQPKGCAKGRLATTAGDGDHCRTEMYLRSSGCSCWFASTYIFISSLPLRAWSSVHGPTALLLSSLSSSSSRAFNAANNSASSSSDSAVASVYLSSGWSTKVPASHRHSEARIAAISSRAAFSTLPGTKTWIGDFLSLFQQFLIV